MEKGLNIAAILKDKPQNTRLWSPIFGDCKFIDVSKDGEDEQPITVLHETIGNAYFMENGKYAENGDCLLFPSKFMLDWSKFAWKKGDVLSCGVDNLCIFNKWENEEYVEFEAEFITPGYTGARLNTAKWSKVTDDNTIKQHIAKIEEIKGGKLNLETLEIEHPKQEFKDGDIVALEENDNFYGAISIFKKFIDDGINYSNHLALIKHNIEVCRILCCYEREMRLATEEEKQQLFSALAKEGKRWNPDTKTIEDLPKKCEFKAFDKVLAKISCRTWTADFFSHYDENDEELPYVCIGHGRVTHCIPYNEETAHLLGTTDEWKGGEG